MTITTIINDPWLKKSDSKADIPNGAKLVCAYKLDLIADCIYEVTFLVSSKTHYQLWRSGGFFSHTILKQLERGDISINEFNEIKRLQSGIAYSFNKDFGEFISCLMMLEHLFRAYYGYENVKQIVIGGIVKRTEFDKLKDQLNRERDIIKNKAVLNETEIVKVARELGLDPQPTGKYENIWRARCPKTKYGLYINAVKNEYKCAVTKCKGGVKELRACVERHTNRIG
ncbi:MAG: hypothetical protein P9L97_10495 [Candidatus Tenebribacter davisii]|nr:hypothetical protein [Candidatus Tenebribacter davisii]